MGYWSAAALILSGVFLIYQYPHAMWNYLPHWVSASSHSATSPTASSKSPPTFTLTGHDEGDESQDSDNQPVPVTSIANGLSVMPPPPRPQVPNATISPAPNDVRRASVAIDARHHISGLMDPPPGRLQPSRSSSNLNTTLSSRVPSTGPLPNRGPSLNSQQRASGGLTPGGAVSASNTRGKVVLSPGHSPMDWAALTNNVSGVSSFQRITPSQLRAMTGRKGKPAWSSWQGKVYNITPYLPFHPGGEAELMKGAGKDGTKLFMDVHPWVNWENMLSSCLVGVMVPEDYMKSELEEMD